MLKEMSCVFVLLTYVHLHSDEILDSSGLCADKRAAQLCGIPRQTERFTGHYLRRDNGKQGQVGVAQISQAQIRQVGEM